MICKRLEGLKTSLQIEHSSLPKEIVFQQNLWCHYQHVTILGWKIFFFLITMGGTPTSAFSVAVIISIVPVIGDPASMQGGGGVRIKRASMSYILGTATTTVSYLAEFATPILTTDFVTVEVGLGRWVQHHSILILSGLFNKISVQSCCPPIIIH